MSVYVYIQYYMHCIGNERIIKLDILCEMTRISSRCPRGFRANELSWRGELLRVCRESSSYHSIFAPWSKSRSAGRDSVPLMDCVSVESRWRAENCPEIEAEKRNNGRVHRSCSFILSYRLPAYHHLVENYFESNGGKIDPTFIR